MGFSPDVMVHVAHKSDNVLGNMSYAANGFRAMTGLEAFRSYDWMTDTAATNAVGDFRGMVISARWRLLITYSDRQLT